MTRKYPTEIFWSDDDEGYIALAPDLLGCSAFGETMAEAAAEIEVAIESWIIAANEAGNPVPPPLERNPLSEVSGKLLLRMPKELHSDLQKKAARNGVSLNSYVCFVLTQRHYHAHAVAEFGKSLDWRVLTANQGSQSLNIYQLFSTNRQSVSTNSSLPQSVDVSTPVAAIGISQHA